MKNKIYLANGLFSEADLEYNKILYTEMTKLGYAVYAPQFNMSINDKTKAANSIDIYNGDTNELKKADILVAVIDGPVVDPGVASEIGWVAGYNESEGILDYVSGLYGDESHSRKKLILGLYTDSRDGHKTYLEVKNNLLKEGVAESQYPYVNLYTVGAIKKYGKVFGSKEELFEYLRENIKK